MEHSPSEWLVVSDSPLIVTAMCKCGNNECHYTIAVYAAVNVNLDPIKLVPIN